MKKALIVVDIQNDFLPGGALAVANGDEVIPVANRMIALKGARFDLVVATQDWHPVDHGSFARNHPDKVPGQIVQLKGLPQILWPAHCVQGTRGAEFAPALHAEAFDRVFRKGVDPEIDSYSGFFDNARLKSTGLGEFLKAQGVTEVYVLGLATDYCVRFTALDAVSEGFSTVVIEDGARAVNLRSENGKASVAEMRKAGVRVVRSETLTGKSD